MTSVMRVPRIANGNVELEVWKGQLNKVSAPRFQCKGLSMVKKMAYKVAFKLIHDGLLYQEAGYLQLNL